jgi:hypothetical protein
MFVHQICGLGISRRQKRHMLCALSEQDCSIDVRIHGFPADHRTLGT